jgi:DNA polymerase III delta subunit
VRCDRALKYILNHFAGADYRALSFTFGEQGRSSINNLLNEVGEPSLFEPTRYVVIRSIEQAKAADLEPISALLARGIEGVHLLIVGASLPNSPNFKKTLDKHAVALSFEELKGAELRRWTEREMRQHGIDGASDELVELALSLAQEDPEEVAALIEKLSLYLDGEKPTTETLRYLVPGRSSASDFELAETLLSKKAPANSCSWGSSPRPLYLSIESEQCSTEGSRNRKCEARSESPRGSSQSTPLLRSVAPSPRFQAIATLCWRLIFA